MAFRGKRGLVPYHTSWKNEASSDESSESEDEAPQAQLPISAPPPKFGGKRFRGKGAALPYNPYAGNSVQNDSESDSDADESGQEASSQVNEPRITKPKQVYYKPTVPSHAARQPDTSALHSKQEGLHSSNSRPAINAPSKPSNVSRPVSRFPGKGAQLMKQLKAIDNLSDGEDSDDETDASEKGKDDHKEPESAPTPVVLKKKSVAGTDITNQNTLPEPKIFDTSSLKRKLGNKPASTVAKKAKVELRSVTKEKVDKQKKPTLPNPASDLRDILTVVAKIGKLKSWKESSNRNNNDVLNKVVNYLMRIGEFINTIDNGHPKSIYWEHVANLLPLKLESEALHQLYLDTRKQVEKLKI